MEECHEKLCFSAIYRERFSRSFDKYNRIWEQEHASKYFNVSSGIRQDGYATAENCPPYEVIANAIQAHNISESIVLLLKFHQKTRLSAYFVLYLAGTDRLQPANETRKVVIYIDDHEKNITEVWGTYDCQVVSISYRSSQSDHIFRQRIYISPHNQRHGSFHCGSSFASH